MIPFLSKIADKLINDHIEELDQFTIVLPSKRAIVFFKHYLSQKIDKPTWLPKIYSIEDFICELSGLQLLDNLSLQFKLYEVYCRNPLVEGSKDSLDEFLKWSQTLLYDFNEIDRYLVDPKSLFFNLKNIKSMDSWNVDYSELSHFQKQYLNFFEHLYLWYTDFQKLLLKDNQCYQGLAHKIAVENISNRNSNYGNVWFVGLNALTTSEKIIIEYFQSNKSSNLFFDADIHYVENQKHEAGYFIRQHIKKWGKFKLNDFFSKKRNFQVIGSAGNVAQSKVVGDILSKTKDENFNQTAVVLADEKLLFPVLNNLPQSVKSLNITMGAPLSSTPLYNLFSLIFNAHIRKKKFKKNAYYYKDVVKLISHPYFVKLLNSVDLDKLRYELVKRNFVFLTYIDLKSLFHELNLQNWDYIKMIFGSWNNSSEIVDSCKLLLESFKEKIFSDKATVETEILFSMYQCFVVLDNHLNKNSFQDKLNLDTIYSIFVQLISKESIPFQGEPLDGLQLMGVLETRTLDFKNVILVSVNEDKLPQGKSSNSFIPFDLKKHYKMATHQERDAIFSYHFYRLLQRCNNAFLIYNTQTDQFGSGEKSRFILQLENELLNSKINTKILESDSHSNDSSETIEINKSGEVLDKTLHWLTNKVSPTAINTYLNCSLKFYFQYILDIRKDKEINEFIESDVFGSVIHDSLEQSFNHYLESNLSIEKLNLIQELTLTFCKSELVKKFGNRIDSGKNHLIWQVANKMINEFFSFEKSWFKKNNIDFYKVLELENQYSYQIDVNGIKVNLLGKIDRIDRVGDQLRIVDYKSGSVTRSELTFQNFEEIFENKAKAKAFQLMMYAYLFSKNTNELGFLAGNFSFKNIKEGLIPLKIKNSKRPLYISQFELDQFEAALKLVIKQIMSEEIEYCQTDNLDICKWCDFKSVCKKD